MTDRRRLILSAARAVAEHCRTQNTVEMVDWVRRTDLLTADERDAFLGASAHDLRSVAATLTSEADQVLASANAADAFLLEVDRHDLQPGETIGELMLRVSDEDRKRLERLASIAFPDGFATLQTKVGGLG